MSTPARPAPPRLARLLAAACLRGDAGEVIAGDLEQEFAEAIAAGLPAADARRRYWRQTLASIAAVGWRRKAAIEPASRTMPWSGLALDVRSVVRTLSHNRGYAAAAVISLAVAIGASAAVVSIAQQLLVARLPVDRPQELRLPFWTIDDNASINIQTIGSFGARDARGRFLRSNYTYAQYVAFRAATGNRVAGFNLLRQVTLGATGRPPLSGTGLMASGNFFDVLRPALALGRPLGDADDRPDAPLAAVIGDRLWSAYFDRRPDAIGRSVFVNGVEATVVGVTDTAWRGLSPSGLFAAPDIIVALRQQPAISPEWSDGSGPLESSPRYWIRAIARVDGEPADAAALLASRLTGVLHGTAGVGGDAARSLEVVALPGDRGYDGLRPASTQPVRMLMGVVAIVLLIACINVAGLMLARGVARQRELAVRRALGAGRGRIVRELLVESTMLSLAGGAAGVWLAMLAAPALSTLVQSGLGATAFQFSLDLRLLGVSLAISVGAGILAGLIPAIRFSGGSGALKDRAGSTRPRLLVGRAILAVQIAVSLPLVAGAGLLIRTMMNLAHVDLGFDADHLVLFAIDPTRHGRSPERTAVVFPQLLDRIEAIPGVVSATLIENPLISGFESDARITVGARTATMYMNSVGPHYFTAMGARLLAGRAIDERDIPGRPNAVVINEAAWRTFFPGIDPIGRRFRNGSRELEVVGVMADAKYDALRPAAPPTMLHSYRQRTMGEMHVVVRASRPAAQLRADLEQAVAAVDASLPIREYRTQREQIAASLGREHVFVRLLTLFGGFALMLACVGLHGVTSYAVTRRTGEIGIRLALGAQRGSVLWMILRQVVALAALGLVLGLPLAMLASPLLGAFLYGIGPRDAATIAAAAVIMIGVAVLAGLLPARRAATVDPIDALRAE